MTRFNRSSFFKQRHESAKAQRQAFRKATGSDAPYAQFLRNNNPLTNLITCYDVSYELDYSGSKGVLKTSGAQTFQVYMIETSQTQESIVQSTKDAVANVRADSGNGFNSGAQNVIDKDLKVSVRREPRGLERQSNPQISSDIALRVAKGETVVVGGIQKVTFSNKAGSSAKMKTDLTKYFS